MKRHTSCLFTLVMMLLCVSGRVYGQELQKSKLVKEHPRSGFDMLGVRANTTRDMEWQRQIVANLPAERPITPPPSPLIATNIGVSGGPAGTEEMSVYRDAGESCVTAALYDGTPAGFSTVFTKNFTTGPGSKYLQVIYTTQANVNDGSEVDGMSLQCLVTQTTSSVPTTVACSNTETLPFLLARTTSGRGNSVIVTYSGYVAVDPSTPTTLEIQVTHFLPGTVARACNNNLIIRY